ncbi:MAG: Mrp/NBP35 family ATP-binding protein [Anaerolineaceae bacterium]
MITDQQVLNALSTVMDPELNQDLVSLNMIEDLKVDGDNVSFSIVLTTPACPLRAQLERDARRAVQVMTGARNIQIAVTSRVQNLKPVDISGNQFKYVIAVGSGKGGVGKSTIAVNLAISLAEEGASVGLLDADIYGPNIPRMLGVDSLPPTKEGEKVNPANSHGIKVVSIGFLVQEGQPLIWRGPMLHSAIQQFLTDFNWGMLDYLVVDMPPGTGDVQLSLSQTLPISGAVVVTTPQKVAVDDAFRAVNMFQKLEVPVLGIVENMSYLEMPDGVHLQVFGEGGGQMLAARAGVPFLGQIPLDPTIGKSGDSGSPIVDGTVSSEAVKALKELSGRVAAEISKQAFFRQKKTE